MCFLRHGFGAALLLGCSVPAVAQQHDHGVIGSSLRDGGALRVFLDSVAQPVPMRNPFCFGGQCLYTTLSPALVSEPEGEIEGFHPLRDGTALSLEIVAIDAALSIKLDDRIYRTPGQSPALGTTPNLHSHPVWQLTVPENKEDTFRLSFRIKTTSRAYSESPVYELRFSNAAIAPAPSPTPTASAVPTRTPTVSPSPTSGPEPIAGDVNCDGGVSAADFVALAGLQTRAPCDADLNGDAVVDRNDHVILGWLLFL